MPQGIPIQTLSIPGGKEKRYHSDSQPSREKPQVVNIQGMKKPFLFSLVDKYIKSVPPLLQKIFFSSIILLK